ncbi:GPX1 [Symbiodinium microadriaticum]|nr:GPX1 [Symbiodinium microadriaticum]
MWQVNEVRESILRDLIKYLELIGLTDRDYKELQMLYSKYASRGLEILAFPCNDFGQQEPSSNGEIARFVASKGVNFPVLGKLSCGSVADAHPLYQFLMSATSGPLTWNFEKILCDRHGVPFRRFTPRESPLSFEGEIVKLLDGESEF